MYGINALVQEYKRKKDMRVWVEALEERFAVEKFV